MNARIYSSLFIAATGLFLLACALSPSLVFADDEVVIQDTSGFTRASALVDGGGKVEFRLVDASGKPADGIEVTLTNTNTGEKISALAVNGSVFFGDVAPGTWQVATASSGIVFTNVSVASAMMAIPQAGSGAGAAAAGGAGAGAGAAGAAGGIAGLGTVGTVAAVGAAVAVGAVAVNAATNDNDNSNALSPSS